MHNWMESAMPGLRVLVVDDEALVAIGVVMLVEDAGHEALGPAHSYQEAVALAAQARPDVVLMDVNLGRSSPDGVAAAEAIRPRRTWL